MASFSRATTDVRQSPSPSVRGSGSYRRVGEGWLRRLAMRARKHYRKAAWPSNDAKETEDEVLIRQLDSHIELPISCMGPMI